MNTKYLTKASIIAALYIVLVLVQMLPIPFVHLTFGPLQLRCRRTSLIATSGASCHTWSFIGCLLSNLLLSFYSGFGLIDILGGS